MQFLKNYSNRELNIWAELFLDLIVSIYFFPKFFLLIKIKICTLMIQ